MNTLHASADMLRWAFTADRRRLTLSLAVLFIAAELFVWFGYGAKARHVARDATTVADQLQAELAPLQERLQLLQVQARKRESEGPKSPNAFLRSVDAAAAREKVKVVRLVPRPGQSGAFDAEFVAGFPGFLRFTAELERLGAAIRDLQLKTATATNTSSHDLSITFTLISASASPLEGAHIDELQTRVASAELRDATNPAGGSSDDGSERPMLPGPHRLTAISRIADTLIATIGGLDYQAGDRIDGSIVTEIRADRVLLSEGRDQYVLRFAGKEGK